MHNAGTDYLYNQANCAFIYRVTHIEAHLGHMIVHVACLTVSKKKTTKNSDEVMSTFFSAKLEN